MVLEVVHRSVRVINDELIEVEEDQKHVPPLLEDLGLTQGNIVQTPRVSPILEREQATLFRSGTMRCAYLAQDRADISETIKCLARGMSKTRTGLMIHWKRVARYLKGVPSSTPHRNRAKHFWKCTWTVIGPGTRQRVEARLE